LRVGGSGNYRYPVLLETSIKYQNNIYPFLRSSKTLSMYVEFPKLFIQKRNAFSSLDTWVSSGEVSRNDICFVWVDSPFLQIRETTLTHNDLPAAKKRS